MCGRYALALAGKLEGLPFTEDSAQLEIELPWESYNIAPGSQAPILDSDERLKLALWGLIPHWSKEPPKRPLFNARSETAASKPSFRTAYARHRCAVPASGFYEWEKVGPKTRKPYYMAAGSGPLLWLAGLASDWSGPDGGSLSTFCILTRCSAGTPVEKLHDRCPVTLSEEEILSWLKGEVSHRDLSPPQFLPPVAVHPNVNRAKHDSPQNILPLTP